MLTKLCVCVEGRNAELRVETGRWNGLQRDEKIYKQCSYTWESGGQGAFRFIVEGLSEERRNLLRWMGGWHNFSSLAIDQLLIDFGQLAYQFPAINTIHHLALHWAGARD